MLYGGLVVAELPLLMTRLPYLSLAVVAAIAVLLWEVRGLFSRSRSDAPLVHSSGGTVSAGATATYTAPEVGETSEATADRDGAVLSSAAAVAAEQGPPMAAEADGVAAGASAALHTPERSRPAALPAPQRPARGGETEQALVVAGAAVIALAVLWLLVRAVRGRG